MRKQRPFYRNNKHTLFSQKNKDKSNEVTLGSLNMIAVTCFFHSHIFSAPPPLLGRDKNVQKSIWAVNTNASFQNVLFQWIQHSLE